MSEAQPEQPNPLGGFLEAAPDAIVVVDERGRIVALNHLTEALFGFSQGELAGRPVEQLLPNWSRAREKAERTGYSAEPRVRPAGELSGLRRDGSEVPVEVSLSPMTQGEQTLMIGIIRDTTVRRQAEARFRGLLESAPDGIVVVDARGLIVIANTQAERLFGYAHEGLIVNELLSNCLKHAFPDERAGLIEIRVGAEQGGRFRLLVRDNGVGLPPSIDTERTETLGLQLVKTLAQQLRASVEVHRGGGTAFNIHFGGAR